MPDIDLNRWSAESLMGWYDKGNFWAAPNPDKPDNEYNREYFGLYKYSKKDWTPLTDCNQLFMVVEKMRELGFYLKMKYNPLSNKWAASFWVRAKGKVSSGWADDLNTAILLAAREAVEGRKI